LGSVHPHTRGEIIILPSSTAVVLGSPPHAWGDCPPESELRRYDAVHPHTRGEIRRSAPTLQGHRFTPTRVGRFAGVRRLSRAIGSPPHAWGDCDAIQGLGLDIRFTPTRVGRLRRPSHGRIPRAVHPHTRGEICCLCERKRVIVGSPPHAWGDSARRTSSRARSSVHPHTRGEIITATHFMPTPPGSPPHAWGDCGTPLAEGLRSRFTPTRVGRFMESAAA